MAIRTELYPYQAASLARSDERASWLVSYEMGLGKTLLSLAILERLFDTGKIRRAVIVAPANVKWQWAKEIARHCEQGPTRTVRGMVVPAEDRCVVVDGPPEKRGKQYQLIRDENPRYVLLTYDQVVNDWDQARKLKPDAIVLDESTYIKTFKAARTKAIKRFTAPYRLALSGTPVESRPEELFSVMQWVDRDILGDYATFDARYVVRDKFGAVKRYKNLDELHKTMAPVMIRLTKEDPEVAPFMPTVVESNLLIPMDPAGKRLYDRMARDFLKAIEQPQEKAKFDEFAYYHGLDDGSSGSRANAIYSAMLALCVTPELLVQSAIDYQNSQVARAAGSAGPLPGSRYCYDLWRAEHLDDVIVSPKLNAVEAEIRRILGADPAHKVVVFSRYPFVVHYFADTFPDSSVVYHGGMSSLAKASAQNEFQTQPGTRLFLSTESGTYGVDLPQASHLINVDVPPNAGRRGQRNGRNVRASSLHDTVYHINALIDESLDIRKLMLTTSREALAASILDGSAPRRRRIPSVTEWVKTHTV